MTRGRIVALVVALVLGGVTARCTGPKPVTKDRIAAVRVMHDHTLRVVADARRGITLRTDGKRIILVDGFFAYAAQPDGSLDLLGTKASYAPLVPDQESMAGFVRYPLPPGAVVASEGGAIVHDVVYEGDPPLPTVRTSRIGGKRPETLLTPPLDHVMEWRGGIFGYAKNLGAIWYSKGELQKAPKEWTPTRFVKGHGDSLVQIGNRWVDGRVEGAGIVWTAPDANPKVVPLPAQTTAFDCEPIPSFDGELYVVCKKTLYTLVAADHWDKLITPLLQNGPYCVGEDGAFYRARHALDEIERCLRNTTTCKKVPMEMPPELDSIVWYEQVPSDVVDRQGLPFLHLSMISEDKPRAGGGPEVLMARNENDIWMIARAGDNAVTVQHTNRIRERVRLPDPGGTRVEVRNETPPTAWSGHCDQVFVPLETIDFPALTTLLRLPTHPFDWEAVEGRLFDREVKGVIFVRPTADTPIEPMEQKIQALIDAYAKNPVDRPKASCTMPVLARVLSAPPQ